jgi:general secretion pathway protein L
MKILGLDLGAQAVKGVLVESAYRGWSVADTGRAAVPAGEAPLRERQLAAARELVASRGWQPDASVVAFPGASLSSNVITLPFTDAKRIEQALPFEVEGQIPFDLADVAWDWQPLGTRDGRSDLYVGVARKEEVAALLAGLASAQLDPRAVVPAAPAYASLFGTGVLAEEAAAEPGAADLVLDLGHERTSACLVGPGGCEAARTFAFGAGQLARALARELGVPEADAAALLAADGGGPPVAPDLAERARDPRAADALRRALVPLVRELRATVKAWQARVGPRPIRRVFLAGEAARLTGLPELLAPEVAAPVAPVALAGVAAAGIPAAEAPGLALALALALRGHQGSRAPRLNLRRGELSFVRDFQHLKARAVRLAAYAGLVLLLGVVSAGVKVFALSRQESALDRALCDAEQKIIGKCYDNVEQAVAIMKGRGTPTASVPKISAVDVFAELSERIPADVSLRLERIEVTRDKLHVQGTTDNAETVDRIVAALRGGRCFGDARSGGARKRSSDGKFEFSVDSALTCVDSPAAAPGRGS